MNDLLGERQEPARALRTSESPWAQFYGSLAEQEWLLAAIHANCEEEEDCCDRDEEADHLYCPSHSMLYDEAGLARILHLRRRSYQSYVTMEHQPS